MKLSTVTIKTLKCALRLERHYLAISPTGSSQHRHFRKLHKLKLLKFVGWGVADGRDALCYEITVKGRKAVAP